MRRARRRLFWLVVLGALGFLFWDFFTYHPSRVRNRIQAPRYAIPKDNAFDYYLRAAAMAKQAEGHQYSVARARWERVHGLQGPGVASAEEMAAYLVEFRPAFAEMRRGLGKRCVARASESDPAALTRAFEYHTGFRALARALGLAIRETSARGDFDRAVQFSLDGLRFSQDIARGAPLPDYLVALAFEGIILGPVREDLIRHCRDRDALRALVSGLTTLERSRPPLADALALDCVRDTRELETIVERWDLRGARAGLSMYPAGIAWSKPPVPPAEAIREWVWGQSGLVVFVNPTGWVQALQDVCRDAITRSRTPTYTPPAKRTRRARRASLVARYLPYLDKTPQASAQFLALWRITTTMAALRLYQLERGHYPDSLQAVVPGCLPSVPRDPFGGQPLKYRREDDSYVLYSIGADLKDNGGVKGKAPGDPTAADLTFWPE